MKLANTKASLRCAVYTRVSTEHGLEQEFNSLDNQREASEAYIKSQAHEGWRLMRDRYDDGGFSGGSMDRPALKKLLDAVRARRVDVIVVYSTRLQLARWGMPSPVFALKGRNSDPGVTNVRNVSSPHWRRWLGVESRCVVPFTNFAENEMLPDGSRPPVWFALDESRPLAFFAGIWTRWTSVRKVKEGETTNDLFAFLTTEPASLSSTGGAGARTLRTAIALPPPPFPWR